MTSGQAAGGPTTRAQARRVPGFDPAVHGFAFANRFVDVFLSVGTFEITTAGRCGGMAYLALDHWTAGRPVPRWPGGLWAPGHVPPDGHWLADDIRGRLFDSFRTGTAAKFVTWTQSSDHATWISKGVSRWTSEDELPKVVAAVDAGRPVPLGLVVARSLGDIGKNHQVLAYGYEKEPSGRVTVLVYDSNSPGREVRLTSEAGEPGWAASNGPRWRGFFVQAYSAKHPRTIGSTPVDAAARLTVGTTVKLSHAWTGRTLHSHPAVYTHPGSSGQQQVTTFGGSDDGDLWRLTGPHGSAPDAPGGGGNALTDGDVVRLRHVRTGRNLHSHAGFPSPLTGQQEVTAFGTDGVGDHNDDWRVEVDGGGPWLAGSRLRLVHVATGRALHSHHRSDARLTSGQDEVTGFDGRDQNDWWTVLEVR
ncbi:MIR domain-containing protein [Cellulomonas sp. URHB0016]